MNLILFGFKGSGKTHFGKLLAQKMHRRFIDTDDLMVELFAKKTGQHTLVREIYIQLGPAAFRALEKEVVKSLQSVKDAVIALGGGAVLDPENVELLQKIGCLVYLSTSPETLLKRVLKQRPPPAILDSENPEASFLEMFQERRPIYESILASKIDCDALDEAGVLAALQSLLVLQDPPNGF
jgi:shikimate kinase